MACRDTVIFLMIITITVSGYTTFNKSDQNSIKIGKSDVKRRVESIFPPECENECINGFCSFPNICFCYNGFDYKKGSQSECEPICEGDDCEFEKSLISCKNGYPNEDNSCSCYLGYEPDPQSAFECMAICSPLCEHGTCVATNECICDSTHEKNELSGKCEERQSISILCPQGYDLDGENCIPKCEPSCTNGKCLGNNVCKCFNGYYAADSSHCEPICEPLCHNSECILPGICECFEGFANDSSAANACEPICEPACSNANCFGPNDCRCLEGYAFVKNSSTECEPICVPACVNGTCIEPNICDCFDDFEPEVGPEESWKCVPSCLVDCGNGTCIPPDSCVCFEGFHLDRNQTCVLMEPSSSKRLLIPTELVILLIVGVLVLFATIVLLVVYFYKRHSGSFLVSYKKNGEVPEFRHNM